MSITDSVAFLLTAADYIRAAADDARAGESRTQTALTLVKKVGDTKGSRASSDIQGLLDLAEEKFSQAKGALVAAEQRARVRARTLSSGS